MSAALGKLRRMGRGAGFTLLELMVALVLSLVVILGLISVMNSVGVVNRTQDGMARLQENGRFAISRIAQDIRAAASQHCSTFGGGTSTLAGAGFTYQDSIRSVRSKFNAAAAPWRFGPPVTTGPYWISPRFMLLGSECALSTCTPNVNAIGTLATGRGGVAGLPVIGTGNGNRARGADVLTMRFLRGDGVRITDQINFLPGDVGPVQLTLDATEAATLDLTGASGDAVWITDCSTSQIARASLAGATLTLANNFGAPTDENDYMPRIDDKSDARVFNLGRDLQTVTYFLQLKTDPDVAGRVISTLVRRQNVDGVDTAQELVEGVERLDFLYGVEDNFGRTRYLTATEVDALATCPPNPYGLDTPGVAPVLESGCGWRAVKSVEVFMLANTVTDATIGGDDEFRYSFLNDGSANATATFENPAGLGTLRNGLVPGRMLRREFRTLVSLRGYNY